MPETHKPFRCEVITPDGSVYSGPVVSAVFPSIDGQLGVLAGRAPMVAALGAGAMTLRRSDGDEVQFFVDGGLARVDAGALTVLAEECTPREQLDPELAYDELQAANNLPRETELQRQDRAQAIESARLKFNLAQLARKGQKWGLE